MLGNTVEASMAIQWLLRPILPSSTPPCTSYNEHDYPSCVVILPEAVEQALYHSVKAAADPLSLCDSNKASDTNLNTYYDPFSPTQSQVFNLSSTLLLPQSNHQRQAIMCVDIKVQYCDGTVRWYLNDCLFMPQW
jgi:hypothetical protein